MDSESIPILDELARVRQLEHLAKKVPKQSAEEICVFWFGVTIVYCFAYSDITIHQFNQCSIYWLVKIDRYPRLTQTANGPTGAMLF